MTKKEKINNLTKFMKTYGFECDQNLNLIQIYLSFLNNPST